jgi:hypothetical protein
MEGRLWREFPTLWHESHVDGGRQTLARHRVEFHAGQFATGRWGRLRMIVLVKSREALVA